ncbi:MAG: isoleucine--tRNA ligase [Cyanobacteria bacterium SIG30]|nr:isoleucine--tRNA ligase [Cyanobacteria bacterium SIG30]
MEVKDTINLPQTTLAMRANAIIREPEIQKFWEENNIYQKMLEGKDKSNSFVLHDGPPYLSSEKIHVGTALNKILKDILIKYKTQKGFYSPYVPGYDAHGLPIENKVVKNLEGGRESVTPFELRKLCREFALKNLKGQENEFKRLGVLGNWEDPYLTIKPDYEAQQVRIFGEMYKKAYVEKGLKPVYWCADCETALAEAEVEYMDHTSTSIYVRFEFENQEEVKEKFNLKTDKPIYSIIWTTTPWTIPSNMAICLHAKFEYTFFEYKDAAYVVATELLESFLKDVEWEDIKKIGTTFGQELEGFNTKHPMYDRLSPIILGDHVTLEAGVGSVHTAPGHGLEDWEVGQKYGIDTFSPLDSKGRWTKQVPDLEGIPYYKGNNIVIEKLNELNALIKAQDITHSYPHCWRCKKPVIYRATPQWFVKVDRFRKQATDAIKNVKWIPQSGEKRIGNMVENRTDWCISRQRAWGVPIPVFYCKECGKPIITDETIEKVAEIFEKESSDAWVKYEAKDLMPEGIKCECGCSDFTKENDIMDVWFDSGVSWSAVVEKRKEELGDIPVDMYLEGSDQHRGWFQSALLTCVATRGIAPYKQVLTHGFVFGEDGRKMSKSLGNFIRPDEIINKYGADILRLWAASVDYRNDIKIGNNIVGQLAEIFKKTRNTARFLLGNLFDFNPDVDYVKYEDMKPIDKFALHRLNAVIKSVDEAFESYEFFKYFQVLQNFAAVDLSSFYLDIVKDRLYTAGKKSLSRRACQTVLYETLHVLVRILAPVMPHQAEDIWQNMQECQKQGLESVLLTSWCEPNDKWVAQNLEEDFSELLKIREIVTKAIEPLRNNENKIIGSSLEASVYITSANADLLKKYESDLKDLFIVSQVYVNTQADTEILASYEQDDIKVDVIKAKGEKCARCWKYRELNSNGICEDCQNAISE